MIGSTLGQTAYGFHFTSDTEGADLWILCLLLKVMF
jgi:hypothetical protein